MQMCMVVCASPVMWCVTYLLARDSWDTLQHFHEEDKQLG